jgi:FlaA1/EpsC-like NDP-sugar epimerase
MFCYADNRDRYAYSYPLLLQWLRLKTQDSPIDNFFCNENIKTIAIYGMGDLGNLFYREIKDSPFVTVDCFVDKKYEMYVKGINGIDVIGLNQISQRNKVEAIIVTPVFYMNKIMEDLLMAGISMNKIISLNQIVCDQYA